MVRDNFPIPWQGNKPLNGSGTISILPGGSGINAQSVARNSVNGAGDATFQALRTITIPGGTLGANDALRVTAAWSHTNSANVKTLRIRFNGTTFHGQQVTANASSRTQATIANRNATNSQLGFGGSGSTSGQWASGGNAVVTSAFDTTTDLDIQIGCDWAGATPAETVTLQGYIIEVLRN